MARSGKVLREKGEAMIRTEKNFRLIRENLAAASRLATRPSTVLEGSGNSSVCMAEG
jgi:hypothetical protein